MSILLLTLGVSTKKNGYPIPTRKVHPLNFSLGNEAKSNETMTRANVCARHCISEAVRPIYIPLVCVVPVLN